MKKYNFRLSAAILVFASCNSNIRTIQHGHTKPDSVLHATHMKTGSKALIAKMQIQDTIKVGEAIPIKFTVYNPADRIQQFCKWHTPFEPLISKYLDIKDQDGIEVAYKGPMAKRIMPPPANSYLKINPKDSLSIEIDLIKGYDITKPARYTIIYNGQDISGLIVKDSISFIYVK